MFLGQMLAVSALDLRACGRRIYLLELATFVFHIHIDSSGGAGEVCILAVVQPLEYLKYCEKFTGQKENGKY